jgi:hypothetical protein
MEVPLLFKGHNPKRRVITMAHTNSASQNSIQKSIAPLLLTWTRCISWTILLSALLAVLFALVLDGCSKLR